MSSELRFSPPPRSVPGSLVIANLFNLFAQIAWAGWLLLRYLS